MLSEGFIARVRERQKKIVAEVMVQGGVTDWTKYQSLVAEYHGLGQALQFADAADKEDSESLEPAPDKFQ
jgi:hypothetical protein